MSDLSIDLNTNTEAGKSLSLRIANVVHVGIGSVLVSFAGSQDAIEVRESLHVVAARDADALEIGDRVVVARDGEHLLLWGRVGRLNSGSELRLPKTLVLEAKESIILRVGDGSITVCGDGKILIKGKDLVSHAKRTNRIKGAAVAIN